MVLRVFCILWVFDLALKWSDFACSTPFNSGLPVIHLHVLEKFFLGRTRLGGFRKTGAVRCRFWLESVEDLKASLESRGQQLFLRHGSWAKQRSCDLWWRCGFVVVFLIVCETNPQSAWL